MGAAPGMSEPEPASEQIRLKCIRKEGFFTVPPEHRVRRRGRAGSSAAHWGAVLSVGPGVPRGRRGGARTAGRTCPLGKSRLRAPARALPRSAPGTGPAG